MSDIDPVEFGELRASVRDLTTRVETLTAKVDGLLELANKSKGGFWALLTLSSAIGGVMGWLSQFINAHPK